MLVIYCVTLLNLSSEASSWDPLWKWGWAPQIAQPPHPLGKKPLLIEMCLVFFPSAHWANTHCFRPGLAFLTPSCPWLRAVPAVSSRLLVCTLPAPRWRMDTFCPACRWLLFAAVSSTFSTVLTPGLKPVCSCLLTQRQLKGSRQFSQCCKHSLETCDGSCNAFFTFW